MVELLAGGRFLPTTGVIGFIERPLDEIVDPFCAVLADLWGTAATSLRREPVEGPLEEALGHLRPLSARPADDTYLLCPTAGEQWTAVFDNSPTGGDPRPAAVRLPDLVGCRTLIVMAVPGPDSVTEGGSPDMQIIGFSLAAPGYAGWADAVRAVTVSRYDGAGEVTAHGDPLPAEGADRPDDLDLDRLNRYLASLGVTAFDASRYFPPGATGMLVRQ